MVQKKGERDECMGGVGPFCSILEKGRETSAQAVENQRKAQKRNSCAGSGKANKETKKKHLRRHWKTKKRNKKRNKCAGSGKPNKETKKETSAQAVEKQKKKQNKKQVRRQWKTKNETKIRNNCAGSGNRWHELRE